jgi:hypothetical protein
MENNITQSMKTLLQSASFAKKITQELSGILFTAKENEAAKDATFRLSVAEEKIAINMAGCYALVCGTDLISRQKKMAPWVLLQQIIDDTLDPDNWELLYRFANITWKAGQPFRGHERIERPVFIPFSLLPAHEVKKDHVQIISAAAVLTKSIPHEDDDEDKSFWHQVASRMQDEDFSEMMAAALEESYYKNIGKTPPPFITETEKEDYVEKALEDYNWAASLAAFYGLESAIDYWVQKEAANVPELLHQIINQSLLPDKQKLLLTMCHAATLAGVPFVGIPNAKDDHLVPFSLLPETALEKYDELLIATARVVDETLNAI